MSRSFLDFLFARFRANFARAATRFSADAFLFRALVDLPPRRPICDRYVRMSIPIYIHQPACKVNLYLRQLTHPHTASAKYTANSTACAYSPREALCAVQKKFVAAQIQKQNLFFRTLSMVPVILNAAMIQDISGLTTTSTRLR